MLIRRATHWLKSIVLDVSKLTFTPVNSSEWSNGQKVPIEEGVKTTVHFFYIQEADRSAERFQMSIEIHFFENWLSFYAQLEACWIGHPEQLRSVVRFGNRHSQRMYKILPEAGWPEPRHLINIARTGLSEKLVWYNTVMNTPAGGQPSGPVWAFGEHPAVGECCPSPKKEVMHNNG
jgi:hypothetical protein